MAPDVQVVLPGRAEEPLLSQLELNNLKRRASAIVIPSLWYENQPFSILEAFALGKPVIASDLGGMRELIDENERGLLIPAGNSDALADAIRWMFENPAKSQAIGMKAFQYALDNYSLAKHYRRLMKVYQDAIG